MIRDLLIGYCLGTANIIPGVSGGTFLLIFNIYERVFLILGQINKANVIAFISFLTALVFKQNRLETAEKLGFFLREKDFFFLFKLMAGALVAIVSLSSLMEYLIVNQYTMTYALFFGLILVSIVIPVKMLKVKKTGLLFFFVLGMVATIYVSWAVNPYDKVERKSRMVQDLYEQEQQHGIERKPSSMQAFTFTGKYSMDEYVYASFCGAVSISAMVLPGISGSLVLILMGEYFEVVSAISGLKTGLLDNIAFLCCFGVGIIIGGLLFARLVSAVLKRYYDATMAFLIGLMAGSLYALWPFKKSIVLTEQYIKQDGLIQVLENVRIYTNINVLPQSGSELAFALASAFAGGMIMLVFVRKEMNE